MRADAVGVHEVVEIKPPHEQAGLLVFDEQVVVGLHQEGVKALFVVEVAVVGVDRALEAAVGEAVEVRVGGIQTEEAADRDGRVEAAFGLAELEEKRPGGGRDAESEDQADGDREAQATGGGFA